MPRPSTLLLAVLCSSCATPSRPPPEAPRADTGAAERQGEELAAAFDVPAAPVRSSPPPPPPDAEPWPPPDEAFQAELAAVEAALSAGALQEAQAKARRWVSKPARLHPRDAQAGLEAAWKVAVAAKQWAAARRAADGWRRACGPARIASCRARALRALERSGPSAASREPLRRKAEGLRAHDRCLGGTERTRLAEAPGCLAQARAAYRADRDRLMEARTLLAEAHSLSRDRARHGRALQLATLAAKKCREARCTAVREGALAAGSRLQLARGQPLQAVQAALESARVAQGRLAPAARPYARPAELDPACAAYEAQRGLGACRKLERRGGLLFRDYSKEEPGEALLPERVQEVNQHYAVLIEQCLTAHARRGGAGGSERYLLRWMVRNDGRVGQVELARARPADAPLLACLREQFELWRYPRFHGEYQHVEQQFALEGAAGR